MKRSVERRGGRRGNGVPAGCRGRKTPPIYRIVEYAPPRAVTFLSQNSTVMSHDRITFDSIAAGTRVTCDADLALKGPFSASDPLSRLAFTHVGDRALTGLTRSVRNIARRARTITVYTDVRKVVENLGLASTDTIATTLSRTTASVT